MCVCVCVCWCMCIQWSNTTFGEFDQFETIKLIYKYKISKTLLLRKDIN